MSLSSLFSVVWWFTTIAGVLIAAAFVFDPVLPITGEFAERLTVRLATSSEDLGRRVDEALTEDDYDSALMYRDISEWTGYPLPAETERRLQEAGSLAATIWRNTRDFTRGFTTGEAESVSGFSGALASDLTVIGDLRDLAGEGSKMVRNEPYNGVVLGLSVIGIGVTGTTLVSGGTTLTSRVGVTLVKVSSKTGLLTARFAGDLTRMVGDAVNFPALRTTLRQVDLGDIGATRRAMEQYATTVRGADLFPVLNRVDEMRANTNGVEAIRLMRYVESTDDLNDVTRMTERFGPRTRGIVEITGQRSMKAFRGTLRAAKVITEYIYGLLVWGGSVLAAWLSRLGFRALRLLRAAPRP